MSPIQEKEITIAEDFSSLDGELVDSEQDKKSSDIFVSGFSDDTEEVNSANFQEAPPQIGDYLLMLFGKVLMYGEHNAVLKEAKSILYGKNENYQQVSIDDLVILKRVGLKIGVFLDE